MADSNARYSQTLMDSSGFINDFEFVPGIIDELIADRTTIRGTMALTPCGDIAMSGTDTLRKRKMGIGWSLTMTAKTEQEAISTSSFNTQVDDVAVGRRGIGIELTYTAETIATPDMPDAMAFAASMINSFEATFMEDICDTITGASTDVGTSGVNFSLDDLIDGKLYFLTFDDGVIETTDIYALVHGRQIGDLLNSIRGETGPMQFRTDIQGFTDLKLNGFQGEILGVQFYASNRVTTSGGNRHGAMWVPGALGYSFGTPTKVLDSYLSIKPQNLPMIIEFVADPETATRTIYANAWYGQAIIYDEKIVGIVTDA